MRVLCIGRHEFLSEHLCRLFTALGGECEPVVGIAQAPVAAAAFEPHVIVADCDLLTPSVLDTWAGEPGLCSVPVLAVSMTRRPETDMRPGSPVAGVIYLPTIDRAHAQALLTRAYRPRGVAAPLAWPAVSPPQPLTASH